MEVRFSADLSPGDSFKGMACVVVDAFRSGATLARAVENGCPRAYLYGDLDALWRARRRTPELKDAWVAGERKGVPQPGFDFGNSPLDVPDDFGGRPLLFSTTNGVRTVEGVIRRRPAACYMAGFVNAAAVCRELGRAGKPAVFICSGTDGRFSLEDLACAGYCVELLRGRVRADSAWAALAAWKEWKRDPVKASRNSQGGRNLWALGFGRDVRFCVRTDTVDAAPKVFKKNEHICVV